jgi:glycosyltransferase involved in cell wall biosynthesis
MMVKVSIIVPVYNVEQYLAKCLESLVNQTLEDIEIIIVNDGITDGSVAIIDTYAKNNDKIKVFRKENGGVSDARNYGMTYAQGEYIGFIDADDFVELNMFELLYKKAKEDKSDIVECDLRHTYEDREDIEFGEKLYDPKKLLMFGRSVVWNKIYKRDWLEKTGVLFPKDLISEDVQFFSMLVPHIRKYAYVDKALIHYVQRKTSLNSTSSISTQDTFKVLTNIYNYYIELGCYEDYKEALEFLYTRILLCSSFSRICKIENKKERQEILKQNWELLVATFPKWKKNKVLKNKKSHQALFMKTINSLTYRLYGTVFVFVFKFRKSVMG